jgi:hypothetical protein
MQSFIALALFGAVSALDTATYKFMQFLSKQNKYYTSLEEFNMRLQIFSVVDEFIEKHNADVNKTSTVGHNFLSDWTADEKKRLTGFVSKTADPAEAPLHPMDVN